MLIDNTLFLRERFPKVRQYFQEYENEINRDKVTMLNSKTKVETIRIDTEDNQQLMVHSKYDPLREAERIVSSHKEEIDGDTHVFFYGVGMGYHIEKFKEMFPNNSYSIYEPIPEVFLSMAEVRTLDCFISNNTKNIFIDKHDTESITYLQEFNSSNKNIHIIVLPSYENIIRDKFIHFQENVKKIIRSRRNSLYTNYNFQKHWVNNSLINFNKVLDTPNILKDIEHKHFRGKPAIIVSAGPSLSDDMENIRYIKDNKLAYIFSVGSAINSLIEYGILPDAVCTYDPGEKNQMVFKKMIDSNIDSVPMVFGSSVGYETLTKYNGPKTHFITTQDRTSLYFLNDQLNLEEDLIIDSPSIAVMTFQLLNKLGANPIIFAGQNLGYLYERRYSEGIEYEFIQSTVAEDELKNAITTKDVYGNEIKTNTGLNSMRESLELFASKFTDRDFINTTKGGALIKGIPFQPIEEVIEEKLFKPIEKVNWWETSSNYEKSLIGKRVKYLESSKREYQGLLELFEKLMDTIRSNTKLRHKTGLEHSLTQFDTLYNKLQENAYYKNFLSFYIRIHVNYFGNEIKRLNQERDPFIKGEEIVQSFSKLLKQCKRGDTELNSNINESLARLSVN
ncbi:motility associated factor glycosyltransferase family protein [Oceanobacillus massiliensis]|uniref:motility associated factor glycosyltransferase family protein n=1 Tax=Oceanobacillus massiliensis TaxID=1465765 RepID=UPI00028A3C4B|nr:6-hydroxymethylpterin diphosphokinase MptE-like protein [Oceanobacillus massiliensis]